MRKLFLAATLAAVCSPAQAQMYKWQDDKGVTHYGETIPAEYANKDRSELSKTGRVVKRTEVLTPEERQAKAAQEMKERAMLQAEKESQLRDKSLLNTYSNVKEIELSRQRNTQQVDTRIDSTTKLLSEANKSLVSLQKEVEAKTRAKQAIAKEDLLDAQANVSKLTGKLEGFKQDKARLEAKFAADLARYKELTGK
ncbi:MAG: DUF4124 domain-containing protein [Sideroxydans sp.]|nr:DUF4124 domain-containing protein [Sideroxydans sp.]